MRGSRWLRQECGTKAAGDARLAGEARVYFLAFSLSGPEPSPYREVGQHDEDPRKRVHRGERAACPQRAQTLQNGAFQAPPAALSTTL